MKQGDSLPTIEKHVTQERIDRYAAASGDFNPIHINEEFGEQSQFGSRVAHGMMTLAFVSEMMTKAFSESWLESGRLKIRFRSPVYPGDTVSTFGEIRKIEDKGGVRQVTCSIGARNDKGEVSVTGDASVDIRLG
jgi:3-hydroxybutyryl-CoA dehydratase